MTPEDYMQKKPNEQGYRILNGNSVHYCCDPDIVFEWALIDRGEGRTPCVGHWVKFRDEGWCRFEDIEWNYGHYFNTIEEAEVYYREQVVRELMEEIEDLKERLAYQKNELYKAKKAVPEGFIEEEDV